MPDTLNKQAIVNLLIDSPLREPIKINLIDIVNNTAEVDLPKVYSTIVKELEIFQKATERRMKLAEETIAKLNGSTPAETTTDSSVTPMSDPALQTQPTEPTQQPEPMTPPPQVMPSPEPATTPTELTATPLDLPPVSDMPKLDSTPSPMTPPPTPTTAPQPNLQPLGAPIATNSSDEEALAEIQKELDSLKTTTAQEVAAASAPPTPPQASTQQ